MVASRTEDDWPRPPIDHWPGRVMLVGVLLTVLAAWLFVGWVNERGCAEVCAATQDESAYFNRTCTCIRGRERYVPPGGARR